MTMKYAYIDAGGWVRQWQEYGKPCEIAGLTAIELPPGTPMQAHMRVVDGVLTDMAAQAGPQPTPTSELQQQGEVLVWVETAVLSDLIAAAVNRCYVDVDTVVRDAIGNRTEEYKDAEADARDFRAAGYAGTCPESVSCFAQDNPTGVAQTNQWAADQIIARADAFAVAKLDMRKQRFASQKQMRAATAQAELDAACSTWNTFIANTRAQLGLPQI